jgi:hypothetical protein
MVDVCTKEKKKCHISFVIQRVLLYTRACVLVIGDFNTHSHVSLNDCQWRNMNDNFFFVTAQQDDGGERERKKEVAVQLFFSSSLYERYFQYDWTI